MLLARRKLLAGLGIGLAAPAIIRTPGLLMPVRPLRPLTRREEAWLAIREWSREAMSQAQFDAFTISPPSEMWNDVSVELLRARQASINRIHSRQPKLTLAEVQERVAAANRFASEWNA